MNNVLILFDKEAQVWTAQSDDIHGIVAEADTFDELVLKLCDRMPEIMKLHGPIKPMGFNELQKYIAESDVKEYGDVR